MYREIAELAKQEKIHFEARQKALQAAVTATAACKEDDPDYKACIHAAAKINWKVGPERRYTGSAAGAVQIQEKHRRFSPSG